VDGQVLKEKFPRLFSISQCSESVVGDIAHRDNITSEGCSRWCLGWRRERFIWEKQEEEQMVALISNVRWYTDAQDRLVWVGDGVNKQEYTVKSGYSVLNKEDLLQRLEIYKVLWSLSIVPSTIVCAWRLLLDRLPTRYNLAKRGIQLLD